MQEFLKNYQDQVVQDRRFFHAYPEVAFEEVETTNKLAERLDQLGIAYQRMEPTGLMGELVGKRPGKTILLRADIDALPVQEADTSLAYVSQIPGKMHACGHDAHMAMLLGALTYLQSLDGDFSGKIRFIFQPAEEVGQGASKMIQQGALEGVDHAFGLHIWTQLPSGQVACLPGPAWGAADFFDVTFVGKGGHGAQPHLAQDALVMGAQYVNLVQTILSRQVDPIESGVITIGSFHSGQGKNVIAQEAYLSGTVRTFYPQARDRIQESLKEMADHVAAIYGGQAHLDYQRLTQVVNNHPQAVKRLEELLTQMPQCQFVDSQPMMVAEDFGYYLDHVPGAFALVGCGSPALGTEWPHHHPSFNIDESTLITGVELLIRYSMAYLDQA